MAYLNQVDPSTVNEWVENFNGYPNNIFEPFQSNEILLTRTIYEAVSKESNYNLNFYFGLDTQGNPRAIVVGSYLLNSVDSDLKNSYADVLGNNGFIFELYSGLTIDIATARDYAERWIETKQTSPVFKKSALLPRQNFIKLFTENDAAEVKIFFGFTQENELKIMELNPGDSDFVLNRSSPCPAFCHETSLI